MARKKETTDKSIVEIKKLLKEKSLIMGKESAIKNAKLGKAEKVFLASNCSDKDREDINRYADSSGAEVIGLKQNNEELGIICKKPFSISVLSVLKGAR